MQLSNNEKNPNEKWTKLNGHFSKEDIRVVQGYMKGCSACLICREMEIKTTMRYQFIPVRMVIIKKICNRCWLVRMWRKGNPYTVAS